MISNTVQQFISQQGWGDATVRFLAGDASPRHYYRLSKTMGETAVLMVDPQPHGLDDFIHVEEILQAYHLSAPHIYGIDRTQGLLLLEDLGDLTYTKALKTYSEELLYHTAVEALVALYQMLQNKPLQPLAMPNYSKSFYEKELAVFTDWYFPYVCGRDLSSSARADFFALWDDVLSYVLTSTTTTLVLRDYHIDNLIWLPERVEVQRVGLLDFQDACQGHLAYDLVSLLEDARRDISESLQKKMLHAFFQQLPALDQGDFLRDYAILGAQRSTKILGVFVRLASKTGKMHYLSHLPRVWAWVEKDVSHPILSSLKLWYDNQVSPEERKRIKLVSSHD